MITTAINWISVADQLPDDDMTVLIADTENDVTLGFHDGDAGWRYCNAERVGDPVTHWAELPDSPNVQGHPSRDERTSTEPENE